MDKVFIHSNDSDTADRRSPRMARPCHKRGSRIAAASLALALALAVSSAQAQSDLAYEAYKQGAYATALRELRPLAEQGNAVAKFLLGNMYETGGKGVSQNDGQAAFWYRKAAEQGYALAQSRLGVLYAGGKGVPQDDRQSAAWFQRAAAQGDTQAQLLLGWAYVIGKGVPEDDVQGYAWLNLAAAQGDEKAKEVRDSIRRLMTREQIAEGRKLSRELSAQITSQGETIP